MRALKTQVSPLPGIFWTDSMVYLSALGAALPSDHWPTMTALVMRSVKAFSRASCSGSGGASVAVGLEPGLVGSSARAGVMQAVAMRIEARVCRMSGLLSPKGARSTTREQPTEQVPWAFGRPSFRAVGVLIMLLQQISTPVVLEVAVDGV